MSARPQLADDGPSDASSARSQPAELPAGMPGTLLTWGSAMPPRRRSQPLKGQACLPFDSLIDPPSPSSALHPADPDTGESNCRILSSPGSTGQWDAAEIIPVGANDNGRNVSSPPALGPQEAAISGRMTLRAWQDLLPLLRGIHLAAGNRDGTDQPPSDHRSRARGHTGDTPSPQADPRGPTGFPANSGPPRASCSLDPQTDQGGRLP